MDTLMADIRRMARIPRMPPSRPEEYRLAGRLRWARRNGRLSEAEVAELKQIARSAIPPLPEVKLPVDPQDAFAAVATNRLEQDVLMASRGLRGRYVMERVFRYKRYMTQLGAEGLEVVEKYKDRVLEAAAPSMAAARYVAGDEIIGESLRKLSLIHI